MIFFFYLKIFLGLHLNMTEGRPIGSTYDSLLDSKGQFLDMFAFRQAVRESRIDFREVRLFYLQQETKKHCPVG